MIKMTNKLMIEVDKSNKYLNIIYICWFWSLFNALDSTRIYTNIFD